MGGGEEQRQGAGDRRANSTQGPSGRPPENRWVLLLLGAAAAGLLGAMLYLHLAAARMFVHYFPLLSVAKELKLEMTEGHLWLEEALSGDRTVSLDRVLENYDHVEWHARAMLEGGTNEEGVFRPVGDPELRLLVERVQELFGGFRKVTVERYEGSGGGPGTVVDEEYDRLFSELQRQVDLVEAGLHRYLIAKQRQFRRSQISLLLVSLAGITAVAMIFRNFERRRNRFVLELEEAQRATVESEEKHRLLAAFSADWVYWRRPDGSFRYVSPACEEVTGWAPERIIEDASLFDGIVHPDDLETWKRHEEEARSDEGHSAIELRIRHRDGSVRWIHHVCRTMTDPSGAPLGIWGSNRDVTEKKTAEEERERLQEKVRHTQKLESLGVLAGGIAHDFNNLLMGILGNADLALLEMSPEAPGRQNLREIETAARRAAELSNQMLAYSGKGRFVVEPVNLNLLVEEMVHLLRTVISKKAHLKFNFRRDIPLVEADGSQIRQLVMNLITNASDALGERDGVITVGTGCADLDRSYIENLRAAADLPPGRYVHLEVSDSGCGMDGETKEKIFDPFFTTKFTGRGLGMAAVLGIVRGHRGAINIYSEAGQGTTVKVFLPAALPGVEGKVQEVGAGREPREQRDGKEVLVLLADDEPVVRNVATRMLESLGCRVITASDGREAVALFGERKGEIGAVILDMTMPRMGGGEAFSEIRRIDPGAKVILSSGYNEMEATNRFAGKGLAGFIQKPYKTAELMEKLAQILP